MAKAAFTPALQAEYERLFNSCIIPSKNLPSVEKLNDQLIGNAPRYPSAPGFFAKAKMDPSDFSSEK